VNATALLAGLLRAVDADPAARFSWLPLQAEYLHSQRRYRLLRTGNQTVGKTTVSMYDLLLHAAGTHPTRQRWCREAGEYWVLCDSWAQSVIIQGKLHGVTRPDLMHPEDRFDASQGFGHKHPHVRIRHTSGLWSTIRFKTVNQRTKSLASATLLGVVADEPLPNMRVYTEAMKRIERGGWMSVCMTPVNAPVEWFRELVEAEGSQWEQHHRTLTAREFIPVGHARPIDVLVEGPDGPEFRPADAAYISALEAKCHPSEVGIVVHGEWDPRHVDRFFHHWTGQLGQPPDVDLWTAVGFDHGSGPGKQTAVLVQVLDRGPMAYPSVYVLAEWADETGKQTPRQDAEATLQMLARWGLQWAHLDDACGDRALTFDHRPAKRSNIQLARWVARMTGTTALHPPIRTAKRGTGRGKGSADVRRRFLHYLTVEQDEQGHHLLTVHPDCQRVLHALDTWDGSDRHPAKDILDALFYALDRWTFQRRKRNRVTIRRS
jgi:hypothetical protein